MFQYENAADQVLKDRLAKLGLIESPMPP